MPGDANDSHEVIEHERIAMSSPLITLDYTKTILRLSTTTYDALLTALISGISQAVKTYCRRDLVSTHYVELYDGSDAATLLLRRFPIITLNSVVIDANSSAPTTLAADTFTLLPATGLVTFKPDAPPVATRFPPGTNNIQVDYTAGFDPIPDDLQLAAALAVGNLFNQPDLTKQREKIGASYYYIGRPGELAFTPEIKAILNLYKDHVT
jgi:uncharacterized phiE125 gp8 family phage protein